MWKCKKRWPIIKSKYDQQNKACGWSTYLNEQTRPFNNYCKNVKGFTVKKRDVRWGYGIFNKTNRNSQKEINGNARNEK